MRTTTETLGTLLGRLCLALIFILSAVGKIKDAQPTEQYMKAMMQAPQDLVQVPDGAITPLRWAAIVLEMACGLMLLIGWHARFAALLLMLFLIAATYYFHPFWRAQGQDAQNLMIQALKNLAILGGLMIVFARGAGMCSLDYRRAAKKEIVV
jgi:putative oxidoreductase